jgi:hypothetical protein
MGDDERHSIGTNWLLDDLAQLELSFGLGDAVDGEQALHVVEEEESLVGLLDAEHA